MHTNLKMAPNKRRKYDDYGGRLKPKAEVGLHHYVHTTHLAESGINQPLRQEKHNLDEHCA